jgi:predicted AlkP superfamily phosphohydrolase/phosphomutase
MHAPTRGISFVLTVLIAGFGLASPSFARVVLVGVDGASWNLIDPRMASGELPNLRALAERGVTGNLESVKPVSSPAVWTSIATGREPKVHGIRNFYATAEDVRVPTAWERLAGAGLRVGLYDYLMTWPPLDIPGGFVIPSWLRRDDRISPPDLFERAGLDPYAYSMEDVRAPDEILENCRRELAEKPGRFVRLVEAHDPDVAAVTFYSVDAASHRFWDDSFPEDFEEGRAKPEARFKDVIPEMLRATDAAVGQIASSLGPNDTILVASDHGFRPQEGVRRVWATDADGWIERTDLDPDRDGFEVSTGFAFVIFRVLPGRFDEREATMGRLIEVLESARSPEGEPLFAVGMLDIAPRPDGQERSWGNWLRQMGVRAFLWWNDVAFDQPAHAYVFGAPQGEVLDPLWPDGEVRLGDELLPIQELTQADDFSGTHDPIGIFVAAGAGIPALPGRIDLSVLDVTPLVYYLSGQPIPDDLDGSLPDEAIDPARLAAQPPRTVAAAEVPILPRVGSAATGIADDDEVTERLRSLGYAE